MEDDIKKKLEELNREDFIKYCETLPMKKYFRLTYSFEVVMKLLDFIEIIDKHQRDLKLEGNKAIVDSTNNFKPSQSLYGFVILEISAFYTNAYNYKLEGDNLPEAPSYWEILKEFRDAMPAHRDKEKNFQVMADWMIVYKKIDEIGMDKIVSDFKELLIKFPNDVK